MFRVKQGAGMGLQFSGPVADLAFYQLCERNLATDPTVQQAFTIKHYKRLKDDIFIIAGNRRHFREYYEKFKTLAKDVFTVYVDEVSNTEVTMLSNKVLLDRGRLRTYPMVHEGAAPLGCDSGHPSSVHRGWPRARLRALARLCSHRDDVEKVQQAFIQNFERAAFPKFFIDCLYFHAKNDRPTTNQEPDQNPKDSGVIRLIMKFHPALRFLPAKTKAMAQDPHLNFPDHIGVTWLGKSK